jgi:hypothetical protein
VRDTKHSVRLALPRVTFGNFFPECFMALVVWHSANARTVVPPATHEPGSVRHVVAVAWLKCSG